LLQLGNTKNNNLEWDEYIIKIIAE